MLDGINGTRLPGAGAGMRRLVLAGLVLATGLAGAAHATCDHNPEDAVPAFETAKEALLDGEYDLFLKTVLPLNADPLADREQLMGPVEKTFPDGLSGCESVVMRRDEPGYAQEIVIFHTGGVPLALFMEAALFRGEMTVMSFQYSQSPSDIFERLN